MLPAFYNPTIKQGIPFRFTLTLKQTDGTPVDLTGATARSSIRNSSGEKIGALAITIPTPADGTLHALLQDTGSLPVTPAHALPFDVFLEFGGGRDPICPIQGRMAVIKRETEALP